MNRKIKQEFRAIELQKQKDKYFLLLLTIKKMTKEKINSILFVLNEKCKPQRIPKYSNEYYLYHISLILTDFQKWESLKHILVNNDKYHYKTIQDVHLLWSSLNIYNDAHELLLKNSGKLDCKKSKNFNIFIDTSDIYNKNGVENIGYTNDPKKKKTKISAICDENKTILALIVTQKSSKQKEDIKKPSPKTIKEKVDDKIEKKLKIIEKELKKCVSIENCEHICEKINKSIKHVKHNVNNKKEIFKFVAKDTLRHDSQTIEETLDILPAISCKNKKLIGDGGYIRNKEDKQLLLEKYNVDLIHPQRKNQKEHTSLKNKKLLKKRYVIENVFQKLKRFDRICMRKDKLTTTFTGFLMLATILIF